jgi:hypothetical protein
MLLLYLTEAGETTGNCLESQHLSAAAAPPCQHVRQR